MAPDTSNNLLLHEAKKYVKDNHDMDLGIHTPPTPAGKAAPYPLIIYTSSRT